MCAACLREYGHGTQMKLSIFLVYLRAPGKTLPKPKSTENSVSAYKPQDITHIPSRVSVLSLGISPSSIHSSGDPRASNHNLIENTSRMHLPNALMLVAIGTLSSRLLPWKEKLWSYDMLFPFITLLYSLLRSLLSFMTSTLFKLFHWLPRFMFACYFFVIVFGMHLLLCCCCCFRNITETVFLFPADHFKSYRMLASIWPRTSHGICFHISSFQTVWQVLCCVTLTQHSVAWGTVINKVGILSVFSEKQVGILCFEHRSWWKWNLDDECCLYLNAFRLDRKPYRQTDQESISTLQTLDPKGTKAEVQTDHLEVGRKQSTTYVIDKVFTCRWDRQLLFNVILTNASFQGRVSRTKKNNPYVFGMNRLLRKCIIFN